MSRSVYGLVLASIGIKMLLADVLHVLIGLSLGIVILVLAVAVIASLLRRRK